MKEKSSVLFCIMVFLAGLLFGGGLARWTETEPVFAQPSQTKAVRAEAFELVDKKGKLRAKLMMGKDEEPMLVVYDKNEKPAAAYGLNSEGPVQDFLGKILRP